MNPAPNHYEFESKLDSVKQKSPRAVIGTSRRANMTRNLNWPGPANYMTIKDFGDRPTYQKISFGKKYKERGSKNVSPGPIYNTITPKNLTLSKLPSFSIGSGPRKDA